MGGPDQFDIAVGVGDLVEEEFGELNLVEPPVPILLLVLSEGGQFLFLSFHLLLQFAKLLLR